MASQHQEDDLWEHNEAAKRITAQYANRIFVQPLGEGTVRISFGEMTDSVDPIYHTSIVATPELAMQFAEVMHQVARDLVADRQKLADQEAHYRMAARNLAEKAPSTGHLAEEAAKPDGD